MALKIFCSRIRVSDKSLLKSEGPLILASNHPNSFLDAIIITSRFRKTVHFLALGEITDKFLLRPVMDALHIIPVYRLNNKNENQDLNEKSFSICLDVLLKNGIILIFPEGISENKWQLGPIKKFTARIAMAAMNHESLKSKLQIQPIGINYNSFDRPGKTVLIRFAEPFLVKESLTGNTEAEKIHSLNVLLRDRLRDTMLQTEKLPEMAQFLVSNSLPLHSDHINKLQYKLSVERNQTIFSKLKKPGDIISLAHTLPECLILVILLAIPAIMGWVSHVLIFYPVQFFVGRKTTQSAYFDSLMFTTLFLAYPVYWIAWNVLGYIFFKNIWIQFILLLMPLLAWATIYWNENWKRLHNYFNLSKQERNQLIEYLN